MLRVRRIAAYLAWTLALMPVQAVGLALRRPWAAQFPRFYHRQCCRVLGFDVRQIGEPAGARPVLFASNHVSYTDITVLGSLIAGSFVAKSEVAGWPFFGWLAKLQRSVFVDRQVRSTGSSSRDNEPPAVARLRVLARICGVRELSFERYIATMQARITVCLVPSGSARARRAASPTISPTRSTATSAHG